jgi:glycosyltransferase involved in cell wall biosynthesis
MTSNDLTGARILAWVHKYPPEHNAGAEWMLHELLRSSIEHGAHCSVVARHARCGPGQLDGVQILGNLRGQADTARAVWDAAHVVVTHLDVTREAVRMARRRTVPLVHLLHNHAQLGYHQVRPSDGQHLVANSEWLARTVSARYPRPVVIHPPVDLARYRPVVGPHDRVVLVNMTAEKGAHVFWRLARDLPDVGFLGVTGGYGLQMLVDPVTGRVPGNVEIIDQTADIVADVYARARLVLMPSVYESWGRVAVEASAGGIPVLFAPTDGLCESMTGQGTAAAGKAIELDDVAGWLRWVRSLAADDDVHAAFALRGMMRARQLDPRAPGGAFDRWNTLLGDLIQKMTVQS